MNMTVEDYIRQTFGDFGFNMSEAGLLDISLKAGVALNSEVGEGNINRIRYGIVKYIPSILGRASSISESGFSMSWDTNGMIKFYRLECKRLGVVDELSNDPKITFL